MHVFHFGLELITGVSVGFEYVDGNDLFEEDDIKYFIFDLFILRILITKEKI